MNETLRHPFRNARTAIQERRAAAKEDARQFDMRPGVEVLVLDPQTDPSLAPHVQKDFPRYTRVLNKPTHFPATTVTTTSGGVTITGASRAGEQFPERAGRVRTRKDPPQGWATPKPPEQHIKPIGDIVPKGLDQQTVAELSALDQQDGDEYGNVPAADGMPDGRHADDAWARFTGGNGPQIQIAGDAPGADKPPTSSIAFTVPTQTAAVRRLREALAAIPDQKADGQSNAEAVMMSADFGTTGSSDSDQAERELRVLLDQGHEPRWTRRVADEKPADDMPRYRRVRDNSDTQPVPVADGRSHPPRPEVNMPEYMKQPAGRAAGAPSEKMLHEILGFVSSRESANDTRQIDPSLFREIRQSLSPSDASDAEIRALAAYFAHRSGFYESYLAGLKKEHSRADFLRSIIRFLKNPQPAEDTAA